VSEQAEDTAAGAMRGLFGSLGFILLMVGLEGMTGAAAIQFGVGLFLALLGALCFYVAVFWKTAKKILSQEAKVTIGHFAQSKVTWAILMFLVFQVLRERQIKSIA
jgi:xanthine/uracil/vitamin C permease (AzgA family)